MQLIQNRRLRGQRNLTPFVIGLMLLFLTSAATSASALTATFDDLGLGAESTFNGSDGLGGFTSGGAFFENSYTAAFDSFTGFGASTTTDTTTPGFGNQFSSFAGGGAAGSAGYGLAFLGGRIVLPSEQVVLGAELTNTTYAALSMRDGDAFAKQFGGESGDDEDFFTLVIEGIDDFGNSTGSVDFLLADYRFADNTLDYIIDEWTFQDLSGLGAVKELLFSFESSDVGSFGINTPVYFAIDNLTTVPEPGTALLLGLGLMGLATRNRAEPKAAA
ncbi:MAG: DUF4465 domain-containing protein [Myxococcota bacterium]